MTDRVVLTGFEALDGAVYFHLTGADGQTTRHAMAADDAARALHGLALASPAAYAQQADALRHGDCPTCRNVRLVDGPGRSSAPCPTCRPARTAPGDYPRALPEI